MKDFLVRPAQPADRKQVLAFCEHTWGEHGDYIADVWDEWLADTDGIFLVGELAGKPVAIGKVTVLSPGEVWLEGMRIAPELRGQGIASAFMANQRPYLQKTRPRVIRLATSSRNEAVHHIMDKRGFQHVATFVQVNATASESDASPAPQAFGLSDAQDILALLDRSPSFAAGHRLYALGWRWPELTPVRLEELLRAGEVVGYRLPDGTITALAILPRPFVEVSRLWLGLLDGEREAVIRLARALRRQAATTPEGEVAGFVPLDSPWPAILEQVGYQLEQDMEFWVFERHVERKA